MSALLDHKWGQSRAEDRIWARVAAMAPGVAAGRLLMALSYQGFFDDSTGPSGEFILAGHIAPAEAWAQFAKRWEELLPFGTRAKNGKVHFKMSEMALSPERMARVEFFYRVIEDHVTTSISIRLNVHDFKRAHERVTSQLRRQRWTVNFGKDLTKPYYVAFRGLMDTFHGVPEKREKLIPLNEKVDFYFDNQSEKSIILAAWDHYLDGRSDDIRHLYGATPRFEDDQEFLPLQAADLWAWWVREWYEEEEAPVPEKMRTFDFGKWRGRPEKKRPCLGLSMSEEDIVDTLFQNAFASLGEGYRDGKGELIVPDQEDPSWGM
jgi:hypothetical protein